MCSQAEKMVSYKLYYMFHQYYSHEMLFSNLSFHILYSQLTFLEVDLNSLILDLKIFFLKLSIDNSYWPSFYKSQTNSAIVSQTGF